MAKVRSLREVGSRRLTEPRIAAALADSARNLGWDEREYPGLPGALRWLEVVATEGGEDGVLAEFHASLRGED